MWIFDRYNNPVENNGKYDVVMFFVNGQMDRNTVIEFDVNPNEGAVLAKADELIAVWDAEDAAAQTGV